MITEIKITKQQKNEVYRLALELFEEKFKKEKTGICIALFYAASKLGVITFEYPYESMRNIFPEFFLSENKRENYLYWFPLTDEGNNKRIEILNECIKLTN